ncbi:hypothetical protein KC950_04210 [Candidatus Saccharibacteria bacterium]|nr:hypothetical protein [Candidatus Saccharibacteria bacterium]
MTLSSELHSIDELSSTGDWDLYTLEDREGLFEGPISPEKACFIGSVCTQDALEDLRTSDSVTKHSVIAAADAFNELDKDVDFNDKLKNLPSVGLHRLIVAKDFWNRRRAGDTNGHMFISPEPDGHDLVGKIDGKPTVWRIFENRKQLNGYDMAAEVGSLSVAKFPFVGEEDLVIQNTSTSGISDYLLRHDRHDDLLLLSRPRRMRYTRVS